MRAPTGAELRNRNVKCNGKSTIRDPASLKPILDADGARQFKPCGSWAANGTEKCQHHGGGLPPTIIAAKRRLLWGAADLVEILERVARDENTPASERIKAINSYLDRAGIRAGVEVSTEDPKWQKLIGKMFGNESGEGDNESESVEPAEEVAAVEEVPRPRKAPVAKPSPRKGMARKTSRSGSAPKFQGW